MSQMTQKNSKKGQKNFAKNQMAGILALDHFTSNKGDKKPRNIVHLCS